MLDAPFSISPIRLLLVFSMLTGAQLVSGQPISLDTASELTLDRQPAVRSNSFSITSLPSAHEVFALSTFVEGMQSIVVLWEIAEGHYLYRQSLTVSATDGTALSPAEFPVGVLHQDEYFGESEVYFDRVMLRIPIVDLPAQTMLSLDLTYQGCAENRYCYPLQTVTTTIELP